MVSTLRSSASTALVLDWQRAWANAELGYTPTDEELALLDDARRRPDYYLRAPRVSTSRKPRRKRERLFRLPSTIC
jgi:hypothetical protein